MEALLEMGLCTSKEEENVERSRFLLAVVGVVVDWAVEVLRMESGKAGSSGMKAGS